MWWNLGFQATAPVIFIGLLNLKKRSTEKKTPWETLPKGKSLLMIGYRSWRSSIPLRNVLRQRNSDISSKIYRVPSVEFPKICRTVKNKCALSSAC